MILKSFEVSSYRSCRKTSFPLQNNLTSLIGVNGSGKSNILNAILLLRKMCEERYRYRIDEDSAFSISNRCTIKAELEHEGKIVKMKGKIKLEVDDHNNDSVSISEVKWNFSNFKADEWFNIPIELISMERMGRHGVPMEAALRVQRRIVKNREQFTSFLKLINDKDFKKDVVPLLNLSYLLFSSISYYSATQFSDPAKCPVSIELEDNRLRRRMRFSSWHEQFIFDLYNGWKDKNLEYKRYFNSISKEGLCLIDNITFKTLEMPSSTYKVQSGGRVNERSEKRFLIVPIFIVNGNNLSPNQLSEGTFKTLALLFYILNSKSGLLLIEEPEVCIHHGLLNSLLSIIKSQSKNKQIVISTHSDYVLDSLKPESVLLVEYIDKKGTIARTLRKTMTKDNFNALKDYLKNSGNLGEYWKEGGLL